MPCSNASNARVANSWEKAKLQGSSTSSSCSRVSVCWWKTSISWIWSRWSKATRSWKKCSSIKLNYYYWGSSVESRYSQRLKRAARISNFTVRWEIFLSLPSLMTKGEGKLELRSAIRCASLKVHRFHRMISGSYRESWPKTLLKRKSKRRKMTFWRLCDSVLLAK